jgi:hypothetical protein
MPRTRTALFASRWLPALSALAILAGPGGSASVTLATDTGTATFAAPAARAADLGLPAPTDREDAQHRQCVADVTGQYPVACFTAPADAQDYITGTSRRQQTQEISLSGTGGTAVSTTGAEVIGKTCGSSTCGGSVTTWYTPTSAKCTHAYPANDYDRDYVSPFYYAQNLGRTILNCNRMVMYRDNEQGGYLLNDCGSSTAVCGPGGVLYRSISWHNG